MFHCPPREVVASAFLSGRRFRRKIFPYKTFKQIAAFVLNECFAFFDPDFRKLSEVSENGGLYVKAPRGFLSYGSGAGRRKSRKFRTKFSFLNSLAQVRSARRYRRVRSVARR